MCRAFPFLSSESGLAATLGGPLSRTAGSTTLGASFASAPAGGGGLSATYQPSSSFDTLRTTEVVLQMVSSANQSSGSRLRSLVRAVTSPDAAPAGAPAPPASTTTAPASTTATATTASPTLALTLAAAAAATLAGSGSGSGSGGAAVAPSPTPPRRSPGLAATVRRAGAQSRQQNVVPHWSDVRNKVLGQSDVMMQLLRNVRRLIQTSSIPAANFEAAKAFLTMPPFTIPPANAAR